VLKRTFDVLLSGTGLVISMPLWAAIAVAVKLEDGGPVFYSQPRVGKDCREFTSLKFRSMIADSDRKAGALPASKNDPRVTRTGRILRATAMDELPQLWNIFRGDMSFVGPRPEWTKLVEHFRQEIPSFDRRHTVRPGLTGLAQIYGHSELPRRRKLRYDLLYIRNQSFWLDLRIVLLSFLVTFTGGWEVRSSKLPSLTRWVPLHRIAPRGRSVRARLPVTSSPESPTGGLFPTEN
jgi:lipopolysaccharide/colanic/teichoic acid biosynthesis glycosyltransferase